MTNKTRRSSVIVLWIFFATLALLFPGPASSAPVTSAPLTDALPPEWRNSIRRVQLPEGKKLISFTFDLCERQKESAGYDAQVVETLRVHKVKATFFAGGKWMRTHPEQTVRLLADPLFEVGLHGWVHENFRLLDKTEAEKRFLLARASYEKMREELQRRSDSGEIPTEMERVPSLPGLFRFPFGTCSADALDILASHGVAAIQWDVVSGDASGNQTAGGVASIVLAQARPGSIVIFHANGRGHGTAGALPGLIEKLRARGFEFVTVSELLETGRPVSSPDCYELRPGDNKRYDKYR